MSHLNSEREQLQRFERQLQCLKDMGMLLESTMSYEEILTLVVEKINQVAGAERSTLYLVNEDASLVSRVLQGGELTEICLEPGQGIAGWVARAGLPLIVPEADKDERFDKSWDEISGFKTRSVICCPIRSKGEKIIAVIEALNKLEGGVFDKSDLEILELVSGQLALSLENSRLMVDLVEKNRALLEAKQKLERTNKELNLLLDIEQRVARSDDLDALAVSMLKQTIEITRARIGILYRPDETGAEIRVVIDALAGYRVIRVDPGTGIAGWVAQKGQEVNLDSPASDPRFDRALQERIGLIPENAAAVPLLSGSDAPPHGALMVASKKMAGGFDADDMLLLKLVAARLSQAIEDLSSREDHERERRLATVGRLLAGVLHDLKSPISVVSGYAELLAEKAGDAEAQDYYAHLDKALGRITTMTEEIIAFSKGERRVLLTNTRLDQFMERFFKEIQPVMEAKRIEIVKRVRISGSAMMDGEKMLRAFHNIARNAVEAMNEEGKLTIEVDQFGRDLYFGFTDTGSGIAEEIQGSLFQSFVTLGKGQGTGLGLAVAREIVEAHGGRISFTTVRNRGTTFLVSIPAG